MLALARGLMSVPRLLLLDEPSLGLAPGMAAQMFDLVRRVRDDGVTVLMVEQDVHSTLEIADRAYVLENGAIVADGPARGPAAVGAGAGKLSGTLIGKEGPMLQLYHYWDSTCSMKCRFAVMEKRLDCELVFVDLLRFEQLRPDYLALNPNGVAPTLVHDGRAVIESTVINEYLEDAFPQVPLLPRDPLARAQVRTLVRIEDGKMHEAFRAPTFNLMIKPMFAEASDEEIEEVARSHPQKWIGAYWKKAIKEPSDEAAVEASFNDLRDVMAKLDRVLDDGRPWLGGEAVSLAECSFVSLVDRTEHLGRGDLFDSFPHLSAWRARLKARSAYREAVPPPDGRMFSPVRPKSQRQ